MSLDPEIRRLLDPQAGLTCLPAFWKRHCLEMADSLAPDQQHIYAEQLRMLATAVEPFALVVAPDGTRPPFASLCATLAGVESEHEFARALRIQPPSEFNPYQWLFWAFDHQLNPPVCLYTIAAQIAMPIPLEDYLDQFRGLPLILAAMSLNMLGGRAPAVGFLESYLGLSAADYADSGRMQRGLAGSPRLAELETNNRARLLTVLADGLRTVPGRGCMHSACLLESYLGLSAADYADSGRMQQALAGSPRLAELEANNRAKFLGTLADALVFADSPIMVRAMRLLEGYLGFSAKHYQDRRQMREVLRDSQQLAELNADNQVGLLCHLAKALLCVDERGSTQSVTLLESYVGVSADDYQDCRRLSAVLDGLPTLAELTSASRSRLLHILAVSLRMTPARGSRHSARLLESYLQLASMDSEDGVDLVTVVNASDRLRELTGDSLALLLAELTDAWRVLRHRGAQVSARLLEAYLGISSDDYHAQKRMRMRRRLRSSSPPGQLSTDNQARLLSVLANALRSCSDSGAVQSVCLLESYLGLSPGDYAEDVDLAALLRESEQTLSLEVHCYAEMLASLAQALRSVPNREHRHTVRLLESYFGLSPMHYLSTADLSTFLDDSEQFAQLRPDHRAGLLIALAQALVVVPGRGNREFLMRVISQNLSLAAGFTLPSGVFSGNSSPTHSAMLLESLVYPTPMHDFTRADKLKGVHPFNCLNLIETWLRQASGRDEAVLETARSTVRFVSSIRENVLSHFVHRKDFLANVSLIWDQIQRIAWERIEHERRFGAEGRQRADQLSRELLAWAEQFESRLLLERLFADRRQPGGDGAQSLVGWEVGRPALDRTVLVAGPQIRQQADGLALSLAYCLDERSETRPALEVPMEAVWEDMDPEMRRELLMIDGRDPELHELVPAGAVWLRALFDPTGRLHWWAWRGTGDTLILLGEGVSEHGAKADLQTANRRFDLEVERIWAAHEGRQWQELRVEMLHGELLSAARDADRRAAWRERLASDGPAQRLGRVIESLGETMPLLADLAGDLVQRMQRDEPVPAWMADDLAAGLQTVLNPPWRPRAEVGADVQEIAARERRRREALDDASRRHLAMVARHLDLTPLWAAQTAEEWAQTDVLWQVDGPLLAAPLAWLPFRGEEGEEESADTLKRELQLWRRVGSVGTVMTLTLRHVGHRQARRPAPRILSVHWDEPENRARARGLFELQEAMNAVGGQHGWETWFLGDRPEATAATLCQAVNDPQRRFGLLIVNAHGVRERYGVRLAQESVWQGSGADLRDTDLVILPACSVGRLHAQDGNRDVAGLCAELAAHRGRTLVAARWPIADTETARFARLVVEEYLSAARAASGGVLPPFARARAFRRALERADADPEITFHLIAAFDLYGLG